MRGITIRRNAAVNTVTVNDGDEVHTFDLAPLAWYEQDSVRERVVNAWAVDHGYKALYPHV